MSKAQRISVTDLYDYSSTKEFQSICHFLEPVFDVLMSELAT